MMDIYIDLNQVEIFILVQWEEMFTIHMDTISFSNS